jgi:thiamine-monophosphate kinase
MDERSRIAMLTRVLGAGVGGGRLPRGVDLAIGDDAAVLDATGATGRLVWTIDEQVDGTHFRSDLVGWRDVGWRSFMAAASDLAAMGADPWCALAALVLSDAIDEVAFEELVAGQGEAAEAIGTAIVGGNLARGPAISIATTLLGMCARPVSRAGARPGDAVWIAGDLGLAAAGLRALEEGRGDDPRLQRAVDTWRRPHARLAAGRAMGPVASAAIDVSDGLARDAGHIAEASQVQIVLDEDVLAGGLALREAAAALGADPSDLALSGGEDYALVVTCTQPIAGFQRLGEVRAGRGLVLRTAAGERQIEPHGYDHFVPRASGLRL